MNGFDLFLDFLAGRTGVFYKKLFETISHADPVNLAKLAISFPEETCAYLVFTREGISGLAKLCTPGNPLVSMMIAIYAQPVHQPPMVLLPE